MESQTTEQQVGGSPAKDNALLVAALLVLAGALWAFYHFASEFGTFVRTLMMLGGLGLSLVLVYQTEMGKAAWSVITGARTEVRKIVWPTGQESLTATLMIAVIVIIFAVILGAIDWALNSAVIALTGKGA